MALPGYGYGKSLYQTMISRISGWASGRALVVLGRYWYLAINIGAFAGQFVVPVRAAGLRQCAPPVCALVGLHLSLAPPSAQYLYGGIDGSVPNLLGYDKHACGDAGSLRAA